MLARHPEGVREGELQDAYPGAAKDLVLDGLLSLYSKFCHAGMALRKMAVDPRVRVLGDPQADPSPNPNPERHPYHGGIVSMWIVLTNGWPESVPLVNAGSRMFPQTFGGDRRSSEQVGHCTHLFRLGKHASPATRAGSRPERGPLVPAVQHRHGPGQGRARGLGPVPQVRPDLRLRMLASSSMVAMLDPALACAVGVCFRVCHAGRKKDPQFIYCRFAHELKGQKRTTRGRACVARDRSRRILKLAYARRQDMSTSARPCLTLCACSEPKLAIKLDQELIEIWRRTALPADPAELDAELRRAGLVRPFRHDCITPHTFRSRLEVDDTL